MKETVSLESLWEVIQSLSLEDKKWLLKKLLENIHKQEEETEYINNKL